MLQLAEQADLARVPARGPPSQCPASGVHTCTPAMKPQLKPQLMPQLMPPLDDWSVGSQLLNSSLDCGKMMLPGRAGN